MPTQVKHIANQASLKILALRSLFVVVAACLPLGHPHVWRQIDTLGVSLRYWLRWTHEGADPWPFLPAILHSGDSFGYMAMEWPGLNILMAPLFAFGPEWGTIAARCGIFSLNLGLLALCTKVWAERRICGIAAAKAWMWMPLFGLGLVYFPKFIPDCTAMLLVLLGSGMWLNRAFVTKQSGVKSLQSSVWIGLILVSCGLLMKPTSIIVVLLLACERPRPAIFRTTLLPLLFALCLTAAYYIKGTAWIQSLASEASLYHLKPAHPWGALQDFLAQPKEILILLSSKLGFWGAIPLLFASSWWLFTPQQLGLWLIFSAQIVVIAALDGQHSFIHDYYFMGTLPCLSLILQGVWERLRLTRRPLRIVLLALLGLSLLQQLIYELRPLYKATPIDRLLAFADCRSLQQALPSWPWRQGYVFRTMDRPYPLVGMCFGERVGSATAQFGLYAQTDPLPVDCKPVLVIGQVQAAECGPR